MPSGLLHPCQLDEYIFNSGVFVVTTVVYFKHLYSIRENIPVQIAASDLGLHCQSKSYLGAAWQ